jgi:PleD family two-component response regulator
MGKRRILVVEDDPDIGNMLQTYFESQGFELFVAARGQEALSMTRHSLPQLIVLDIMLPDMDGYEICRQLRSSSRTAHIPILFLTQRDERRDRIAGLELGADDYITKPFDIEELRLRVLNAMTRAEQESLTDPCTGLPTSRQIQTRLEEILPGKSWSMLNCRLIDFPGYRAVYGESAGEDFLRFSADLILQTVDELGSKEDFIGFAGGDSFVVVTEEARALQLEAQLKTTFKRAIPGRYSYLDQQRGYLMVPGPAGAEIRTPLISLMVTIVHASQHNFTDIRQITELAALAGQTGT